MVNFFTLLSLLFSLLSVFYWYRSSVAKINDEHSQHKPGVEALYDDPAEPGKQIRVFASAMEQARLSKIAAIYTAAAIFFQIASTAAGYLK